MVSCWTLSESATWAKSGGKIWTRLKTRYFHSKFSSNLLNFRDKLSGNVKYYNYPIWLAFDRFYHVITALTDSISHCQLWPIAPFHIIHYDQLRHSIQTQFIVKHYYTPIINIPIQIALSNLFWHCIPPT